MIHHGAFSPKCETNMWDVAVSNALEATESIINNRYSYKSILVLSQYYVPMINNFLVEFKNDLKQNLEFLLKFRTIWLL